jgi:hypothetical protein
MRKFLITVAVFIVVLAAIAALWLFGGRQISLFSDRFGTVETASIPVTTLLYEGNGAGGVLHVNDLALNLSPPDSTTPPPNVGTTPNNQLALSFGGKVFAFGPVKSDDALATTPQPGDDASISVRHSAVSWPGSLDFNFMTGQSPPWRRHLYYQLTWQKPKGAKLEMLWRYEQHFLPPNGWTTALMTREGTTGLVKVDIQN